MLVDVWFGSWCGLAWIVGSALVKSGVGGVGMNKLEAVREYGMALCLV